MLRLVAAIASLAILAPPGAAQDFAGLSYAQKSDLIGRCRPDEVCGGDPAGPIVGCMFADPGECARGASASVRSYSSGPVRTEATERDDPAYEPVVALLSPGRLAVCSGTIVTDNLVLTAAPCVGAETLIEVFVGDRVPVSEADRKAPGWWSFPITSDRDDREFLYDPEFCGKEPEKRRQSLDLALVRFNNDKRLAPSFRWTPTLNPWTVKNYLYMPWTVIGFGVSERDRRGGIKRYAQIEPAGYVCGPGAAKTHGCIEYLELVKANDPNEPQDKVDTCLGDSGGPVVVFRYFAGVTRRNIDDAENSDCGYGGIYGFLAPEYENHIADWLGPFLKE